MNVINYVVTILPYSYSYHPSCVLCQDLCCLLCLLGSPS